MKTINFKEIKTPQTVDEFRENLKKYFVCIGKDREYLMTRGKTHDIPVDTISSFSDLYNLGVKMITPSITVDVKKISNEDVFKNMFSRDFSSVLSDEKRFPIYELNSYEDVQKYIHNKNPMWFALDNQILRCFYAKTLGDFSGYSNDFEKTIVSA